MLPADMRSRIIATNAQLIRAEIARCELPAADADRLEMLLDQLQENAELLAEELALGERPTRFPAGSNVVPLRRHG